VTIRISVLTGAVVATTWISAAAASAQAGDLSPYLAQPLVVEVRSTFANTDGRLEPELRAAGIIIGLRSDTLFIVTAKHNVEGVAVVQVRLRHNGVFHPAAGNVILISGWDIALIAVTGHSADPDWRVPFVVPRSRSRLRWRERLFVLGCPNGNCWLEPQEAELSGSRHVFLFFRTHYIKPGMSGGPLVDSDGALVGLVVGQEEGDGRAIWWEDVELIIRAVGYPVNLPRSRGYSAGELGVRVLGAAWPSPGLNTDGRYLQPGWRAELTKRILPPLEVATGFTRVSFAASPVAGIESDYEEAYAHLYWHLGARFAFPVTRWSIGRNLPDLVGGGMDLLVPIIRYTEVVGLAASDSVDLVRGEYVRERSIVHSRTGISLAYRISYRIALSERLGIVVAPSLYLINFDYLDSSPARGVLEVGGDLRVQW
jgi:hypothetical protein